LTPLFWAALEGNLSLLQRKAITVELLSRPVCLPRGEDPQFHLLGLAHKATLLHWAAAGHGTDISAHIATAEFLIKEGNISIDTPDLNGRTPLHYATLQGFPQMVDYLIQQRATVNWRDVEGATALHRAALKGNLASVRSLMTAGASMYIQNLSGDLPIHWALDKNAQGDSLNVVREFLDQGIDPEYRHDDPGLHGRSLLDCARSEKRADVEKLLRDRIAEAHP
jgi:ankyrin repeat protein